MGQIHSSFRQIQACESDNMIQLSPPKHDLLDILDTWLDAQAEGACDYEQKLQRPPSAVRLKVLVSAGPNFRTSCELPAEECSSVNKLLKATWEAVQEEVAEKLPGETYKWWEPEGEVARDEH